MHSSLRSEKPTLLGKGAHMNKCEHVNSVWKVRHRIYFFLLLAHGNAKPKHHNNV